MGKRLALRNQKNLINNRTKREYLSLTEPLSLGCNYAVEHEN